ncbi:DUF6398 domain-containing protein [Methylobacter sp. YRD-M1]|uniref:DUF6398 domain-containing protein n=1 Tax=Methylobacter sp. YRD-M1 TaxID=2911520 RepID=UPI00227D1AE6|nr:DUF6398 domain-containing protein [Methylobacter sp. YRD-M1]
MSETEQVPAALQGKYDEIVALTDQFCQQHLNEEYRSLCRRMAAKLCRKRPSPVATGKPIRGPVALLIRWAGQLSVRQESDASHAGR